MAGIFCRVLFDESRHFGRGDFNLLLEILGREEEIAHPGLGRQAEFRLMVLVVS